MNDETNYLAHHGIKGQKWGVRRYQYEDGTYTPLGREHYGFEKVSQSSIIKAKINEIANSGKLISKTAKSYITGKNLVDSYLKKGTTLSRIQSYKDFEDHAFYATYKKQDIEKYEGLFGNNLKRRAKYRTDLTDEEKSNLKIYKLNIKAQNKLKIPSDENAADITSQLLRNKAFKENLLLSINDSEKKMKRPQQKELFKSATYALGKNNLSKKDALTIYKALNLTLTNHEPYEIEMQNSFYGELKKKGYSALIDTNDKDYSSYHAKRPVIVFDLTKVGLQAATELDNDRVDKLYKKYSKERIKDDAIYQVKTGLITYGKMLISDAKTYNSRRMNKYLLQ